MATGWALLGIGLATATHASLPDPETIRFRSLGDKGQSESTLLNGYLYRPADAQAVPAVVMFHGCAAPVTASGRVKRQQREIAERLLGQGYAVLVIDSLRSRGIDSQCGIATSERAVRGQQMRMDGYGALEYLSQRSDIRNDTIIAMGHAFAANYALNVLDAHLLPYGLTQRRFAGAIGLAPACKAVYQRKRIFQPYAPVLLLAGAQDERNPAEFCQQLAQRSDAQGDPVSFHLYPDGDGSFYRPDDRGGNRQAREDAYARIEAFLTSLSDRRLSDSRLSGDAGRTSEHALADEDLNPEGSSGYIAKEEVTAPNFMVATAHPLATKAGHDILSRGGSAIDAAIAAQMMLNLVEPQSSGIGGGGFVVYYDRQQGRIHAYDGRETAPAAARPDWFVQDGKVMPFRRAVNSGLSVGVPGLLRMLEMAHGKHGKLPWHTLFEPAIERAEQGFPVSHRLHLSIRNSNGLADQPAAARFFLDHQGQAWPVGHILRNPELARTLRLLSNEGAGAFYHGEIAKDIVAAIRAHEVPGGMTLQDLANYKAIEREPLCGVYRQYRLCGMPPPSSGLTVLQMLGILQNVPMAEFEPAGIDAVHYFAEAGRLAYADRDHYIADPAFVDVPVQALLSEEYLRVRTSLIRPDRSLGQAQPGDPVRKLSQFGKDNAPELPSTSHIVAVDREGNIVSMTTTIESEFGSKLFVRGFLLNNEMTDFSRDPYDKEGRMVANRVEANKRPRSAMSPFIVLQGERPVMAIGSPGGSAIINYVAKTLVAVLDWELDIQQAISLPNFGSRNKQTELEAGTTLEALIGPLRARGHVVSLREFPSGLQGVVIEAGTLRAGADPRREGVAKGG